MARVDTVRAYVLAEFDRCPRCLCERRIKVQAIDAEGVRHGVCPNCEATVTIFKLRVAVPDEQESG